MESLHYSADVKKIYCKNKIYMYQFRFLISCKVITIFRGKSTTKNVRRARRFLLIQVNEYIYINTHV